VSPEGTLGSPSSSSQPGHKHLRVPTPPSPVCAGASRPATSRVPQPEPALRPAAAAGGHRRPKASGAEEKGLGNTLCWLGRGLRPPPALSPFLPRLFFSPGEQTPRASVLEVLVTHQPRPGTATTRADVFPSWIYWPPPSLSSPSVSKD